MRMKIRNISSKVTCSKKNQFKRNFTFRATLKLLFFIVFDPFLIIKRTFLFYFDDH